MSKIMGFVDKISALHLARMTFATGAPGRQLTQYRNMIKNTTINQLSGEHLVLETSTYQLRPDKPNLYIIG